MDRIKKLLTGELTMQAFIPLLQTNEDVQNQLRSLLPQEACYNPQHPFWERISYDSVQRNGFDYYKFLCWMCRFDSSLGDNLNILGLVYVYTLLTASNILRLSPSELSKRHIQHRNL